MKKEDCIFCQIVAGESPAKFVYKSKNLVVFKNIQPTAPVHVLIIPKNHIDNLSAATSKDQMLLGEILLTAALVAKKLKIEKGYKVLMANGKAGGQTVPHMHYHLVGGWRKTQKEGSMDIEN